MTSQLITHSNPAVMKKTAARDAWREIEPSLNRIAEIVSAPAQMPHTPEPSRAPAA